jgi:ACT domain-containing protein
MAGHKIKKNKVTLPAHAPNWTLLFLQTLGATGNVTAACKAADVSRKTVYKHRDKYPQFADAWEGSMEDALDKLEGVLWKVGADGNTRAIELVLKARRPIFREGNNAVNVQVNNNISLDEERRLSEETHVMIDQITGRMTEHKMIEDVVDEDTKESD